MTAPATVKERLGDLSATERNYNNFDLRVRLDLLAFVSFDLVGSTAYKLRNDNWPDVVDSFYQKARSAANEITNSRVWKYLGDEVVFCCRIEDVDDINRIAPVAYDALQTLYEDVVRLSESALSVKAVSWLAPIVSRTDTETHDCKDLVSKHSDGDRLIDGAATHDGALVDFVGPQMDAGFRLGHFARARQLVCSPMLAHYSTRTGGLSTRYKIVDFAKLKGVANEIWFPGIWYSNSWTNHHFRPHEQFVDPVISRVVTKDYIDADGIELYELQSFRRYLGNVEAAKELLRLKLPTPKWLDRLPLVRDLLA